jgi:hypothetical protein
LFVLRTSLSCFRVLLHFMTNCRVHYTGRRSIAPPPGADGSMQNSGEAASRRLEPMLLVHPSQRTTPQTSSLFNITHENRSPAVSLLNRPNIGISSAPAVLDVMGRVARQSEWPQG